MLLNFNPRMISFYILAIIYNHILMQNALGAPISPMYLTGIIRLFYDIDSPIYILSKIIERDYKEPLEDDIVFQDVSVMNYIV